MANYSTYSTSLNEAAVRKTYIFTKYEFYKNSNSCGMGRNSCGMNKIKIVGTDATLLMPIIQSDKTKHWLQNRLFAVAFTSIFLASGSYLKNGTSGKNY